MEELASQVKAKEEELKSKSDMNLGLQRELERLTEELNTQKGRCANL